MHWSGGTPDIQVEKRAPVEYPMTVKSSAVRLSPFSFVYEINADFSFCLCAANYMDNWKCTGILKGDGSPLTGSSGQPSAMSTVLGSSVQSSQNALNGMSAGR